MEYCVGDHVLDMGKFELRRGGERVPAEPQVLQLLLVLLENRDRLVTKDELVATVWKGRAVSDSAIASRVKSARRLLGDSGEAQRLIRTVHGQGFRFVGQVALSAAADGHPRRVPRGDGKPSIAVLPFECADPALGVFADGLAHELIIGLSSSHSLAVIARGSSFRLRGWDRNPHQVGLTLDIGYCLCGIAHRNGTGIAVALELVDVADGSVIWGEMFEGSLDRLLDFRAVILAQVLSALEVHIPHREAESVRSAAPAQLDAWSCYHLGLQHIYRFNHRDNARALDYFEQAVRRDPGFARAHAGISFARFQNAFVGYSDDTDREARLARASAELAVELDEHDPTANLMMGRSLWLEGQVANSVPWLERCLALRPSYAQALYARAWTQMISCQPEEGQRNARGAIRLSPIDPLRYAMLATDALSHATLGDYESAAAVSDRAAREPRAHVMIAAIAAMCHVWAGNVEGTRHWAKEVRTRGPRLTQDLFFRSFPFADPAMRNRAAEALSSIGV